MDTKATLELIDELQENIEDLEENLGSLLSSSLAATSRKLPLLDRAKLNVLLVYSIESLLFSYLRLHGVQVKEHPVFKELTRVKQYFEKIKTAEAGPDSARPAVTLNKEAATRVIRHGLVGSHCGRGSSHSADSF
jgi:exosome complex protein LRP1